MCVYLKLTLTPGWLSVQVASEHEPKGWQTSDESVRRDAEKRTPAVVYLKIQQTRIRSWIHFADQHGIAVSTRLSGNRWPSVAGLAMLRTKLVVLERPGDRTSPHITEVPSGMPVAHWVPQSSLSPAAVGAKRPDQAMLCEVPTTACPRLQDCGVCEFCRNSDQRM